MEDQRGVGRKGVSRRVRALLTAVVVLVPLMANWASPGQAPPKTRLRANAQALQAGRLISYCWSSSGAPGVCVDGVWAFPRAVPLPIRSPARIRIRIAQRPNGLRLRAARRTSPSRFRPPPFQRLAHRLQAHVREGRTVAWDVLFKLASEPRHYYLALDGRWRGRGDALWAFHARTAVMRRRGDLAERVSDIKALNVRCVSARSVAKSYDRKTMQSGSFPGSQPVSVGDYRCTARRTGEETFRVRCSNWARLVIFDWGV